MENSDNRSIAAKLEELDTLPAGYQPNLDSKWTLLEASLEGQNKTKRAIVLWTRAAAVLIIFTLAILLLMPHAQPKQMTIARVKPAEPLQPAKPEPAMGITQKKAALKRPAHNTSLFQTPPENAEAPVVAPAVAKTAEDPAPVMADPAALPEAGMASHKKKKARYVQMDFGQVQDEPPREELYTSLPRIKVFGGVEASQNPRQTNPPNSAPAVLRVKF